MADGRNGDFGARHLPRAARQKVLACDVALVGVPGRGLGRLVGAAGQHIPEGVTRREVAMVGLLELRVEHDQQRHDWSGNRLAVHQVVGQAHEVVARDRRIHHVALEGNGWLGADARLYQPG